MAGWAHRRSARRARGIDVRLLVVLVLSAGLLAFYACRQRATTPLSPLIGHARVADGDSIELAGVRIRLEGIDAPELDQPCTDAKGRVWRCGEAAARELRRHLGGQELRCERRGVDQYHRILATCALPDGSDVSAWIVQQGWALAYGGAGEYRSEQDEAQAAGRGIWAGSFTPPREWRDSR
jgi:endonuclease YncB( thermonuclease family)